MPEHKNNFKAVLKDAPGLDRPKQLMLVTQDTAERWARDVISGLTPAQKLTAFVRVTETVDMPVCDIHAAKVGGEFAVARYTEGEKSVEFKREQ